MGIVEIVGAHTDAERVRSLDVHCAILHVFQHTGPHDHRASVRLLDAALYEQRHSLCVHTRGAGAGLGTVCDNLLCVDLHNMGARRACRTAAVHDRGCHLYVSTQLSHVNDASQVADASENEQKDEWAVHQLKTTRGDYNYDSWVWLALTQGLNLQSIHHVFPSVHWAHYPEIYRIVWAAGGEHRRPKSFHEIVVEHLAFVAKMNA